MSVIGKCIQAVAITGVLLGAAPVPAAPCEAFDPQVLDLMRANARSAAAVRFSGVLTLQRGGDTQIVEISRDVHDGRERAVMLRLTGQEARVVMPLDGEGDAHPGQELRLAATMSEGAVCGLATHYRFRIAPGERVAGRETLRLRVEPRDMYRYGHILDLDRESALVLRASTLGADEAVIEQYQFASLQLHDGGHVGEAADTAAVAYAAVHPHPDEAPASPEGFRWQPGWLPAGFTATDAAPASSARKSYTDGMASFSVFFEAMPPRLQPGEGVERQGSTVAYTRGTRLQGQPVLITVLGEVPVNTARMVADSVRLQRP